jgi:hypothetical protein
MRTRTTTRFLAVLAVLAVTAGGARAEQPELTEDQQAAKTIFENNLFDAQEKLAQLKTGEQTLTWKEYEEVSVTPVKQALDECRKAKLPDATPLDVGGKQMTFADAARLAGSIEADFKKAFGQKDDKIAVFKNGQTPETLARYDAFKAKMTEGLSGDKLRLMNEEVLIEAVVYATEPPKFIRAYYGEGRKQLLTPADFAAARIWVTADHAYASDDALKRDPHWRVSAYHFDGMKLVRTVQDRGPGKEAPAKFFEADQGG